MKGKNHKTAVFHPGELIIAFLKLMFAFQYKDLKIIQFGENHLMK